MAIVLTPRLPYVCPVAAAEWGLKLINSRDGEGEEDGWQLRKLEPEDRQHLAVLQLAGRGCEPNQRVHTLEASAPASAVTSQRHCTCACWNVGLLLH